MSTRRQILVMLLMIAAMGICAQERSDAKEMGEDAKVVELRRRIGIDYSMADFSTSRIDGKVIGERLARMLRLLGESTQDHLYKRKLTRILCEQHDRLNYAEIDDFKIKRVQKRGDVIKITILARLLPNSVGIKKADIVMSFNKGVAESQPVNELFSDLSRHTME